MKAKTPTTLQEIRLQSREAMLSLANRYGVQDIQVFGSVARGDATAASDIDVLISVPDKEHFDFFKFWYELEDLVGRDVDLVERDSIHWAIKEQVLQEAQPL